MVSATFNSDSYYQYWRADKAMQLSYVCAPVSTIVCGVRTVSLVPRPLPPRRGLVHTVCTCVFFRKKLRGLPCPYAEDYTIKYTVFYKSPKNWGYLLACPNSVYQASSRGGGAWRRG